MSKGAPGAIIYALAETGDYNSATWRERIYIETDFKQDYFVISDLGYKVGLLKTWGRISKDRAVALKFAKELDSLSNG